MDNLAKFKALLEAPVIEQAARELGIPDGTPVVTLTMDAAEFNPEWSGYELEFLGVESPPPPDDIAFIYAEHDGVGIRVWRIRVRKNGVQAFLEARSREGYVGVVSVDLLNLDPLDRTGNAEVLTKGMAMLYPRVFRSRPQGTAQFNSAAEFHEAYREALAKLKRRNSKPRADLIADELNMSKSTYYEYRRRFGTGQ